MSQFTELSISLDQPNKVIISPQDTDELYPVELIFNSQTPLRLRFYRNYDIVNLTIPTLTITLKEFDEWDTADNLASESTWVETVSGDDVYYDGTLDLSEANMASYFGRSRESFRMAYGAITLQNGYGFTVIPFTAKILRSPVEP